MLLVILWSTLMIYIAIIYANRTKRANTVVNHFEQHQYKFVHEYAKLAYVDNHTLRDVKFVFHKMNRTTGGLNVSFLLTDNLVSDSSTNIEVAGYQFRSNEYRLGPIHFNLGMCTTLRSQAFDVQRIIRNSNLTQCPMLKGHHFINQISPDAVNFPPLIPDGKWMFELNFTHKQKMIASLQWMLKVEYVMHF